MYAREREIVSDDLLMGPIEHREDHNLSVTDDANKDGISSENGVRLTRKCAGRRY